jgi:hypothetical protein
MAFDNNIITILNIQEYKPLSKNTNTEKKVNPYIQEAQEFDLRPFMGDEFYLKLIDEYNATPTQFPTPGYKDLYQGSTWTKDGKTYENPGIKAFLVYCSYARYINTANTNSTAFGMVGKNNPDSTPITDRTIDRLVSQTNNGAKAYLRRVEFFIECNPSIFPLFRENCNAENKAGKTGSMRMSAAGGNSSKRRKYDPVTKRYYN